MVFLDSPQGSSKDRSNFRIQLPVKINLSSEWKVALTEITYPNSLYTFDDIQTIKVHTDEGIDGFSTIIEIKPDRYESLDIFVNYINTCIKQKIRIQNPPHLVAKLDYVSVENGSYSNAFGDWPVYISVSETLTNILGVSRGGRAFMKACHTNLYLYADIVSNRHVGDSFTPLLRQFSVANDELSTPIHRIFKQLHFCSLSRFSFQEIELQLLNDQGLPPHFKFGNITIALTFIRE